MSPVLKDKVAIVTGGGRGLGRVYALRFAQEGASLLLPDINLEMAEGVAKEIEGKGGKATSMKVDISDENQTKTIADRVMQEYGKVDILINNAGIYYGVEPKPWDAWSEKEWDRLFEVNVKGTWLVCNAIAPLMIKAGKGKIINVASDVYRVPDSQFFLPYALTKASVYYLTQSLASALGPSGINVNAIAPGFTATESSLIKTGSGQIFDGVVAAQALKRRQEPEDLAGTAVFLASADSDFITGQCITVDGGHTMA
ncbi:MAG TPA: glucose 1-dehydrogenase [Dehalococcoidia bacterium]|nr:glucose 1-dehydrogenase [Dehalococcoidia bacterium]